MKLQQMQIYVTEEEKKINRQQKQRGEASTTL